MAHFCFVMINTIMSVCVGLIMLTSRVADGKVFRLAWMVPSSSSNRTVTADSSIGALKLALRSVTDSPTILKGHTIHAKYFQTSCQAHSSMAAVMKARTTFDPDVIIGPPCEEGMKMVAHLSSFWNLPVFSWYNSGPVFDNQLNYPTLIRVMPPIRVMAKSLVHLLRQHGWRKFSLLYGDSVPWKLMEDAIRNEISETHFRLINTHLLDKRLSDADLNLIFTVIKRYSTILVFACPANQMRRYILAASRAGLGDGQYVFIQLDHQFYPENVIQNEVMSSGTWRRGLDTDAEARRAYEHVIRLVVDPMTDRDGLTKVPRNRYEQFCQLSQKEAREVRPEWELPVGTSCDVYSLFLYDAVLVWSVLAAGQYGDKLDHRDGKLMARRLLSSFPDVNGATGHIRMTEDLDRVGTVFVLDMGSDGNFRPAQIIRFNTTNGYSVLDMIPKSQMFRWGEGRSGMSQTPRDSPIIQPLHGRTGWLSGRTFDKHLLTTTRSAVVTTEQAAVITTTTSTKTTTKTTTTTTEASPLQTTKSSTVTKYVQPSTVQEKIVKHAQQTVKWQDKLQVPVKHNTIITQPPKKDTVGQIIARLIAIERAMKARSKRPVVVVEPEELTRREREPNGVKRKTPKDKKRTRARKPFVGRMSQRYVTTVDHSFIPTSTEMFGFETTTEVVTMAADPSPSTTTPLNDKQQQQRVFSKLNDQLKMSDAMRLEPGRGQLWVMDSLVDKISRNVITQLSGRFGNSVPIGNRSKTKGKRLRFASQHKIVSTPTNIAFTTSNPTSRKVDQHNNIKTVISQLTGAFNKQLTQMKESLNNITQTIFRQVNVTDSSKSATGLHLRQDITNDVHVSNDPDLKGVAGSSKQTESHLNDSLVDRISLKVADKLAERFNTTPLPKPRSTYAPNVLIDWMDEMPPEIVRDIHRMNMGDIRRRNRWARHSDQTTTTDTSGLREKFRSTMTTSQRMPLPVPPSQHPTPQPPRESARQGSMKSNNRPEVMKAGPLHSVDTYFDLWRQFLEAPRHLVMDHIGGASTPGAWKDPEIRPTFHRQPMWGIGKHLLTRKKRW